MRRCRLDALVDEPNGLADLLRMLARRATAGCQGRAGADAGPRRSAAEPP